MRDSVGFGRASGRCHAPGVPLPVSRSRCLAPGVLLRVSCSGCPAPGVSLPGSCSGCPAPGVPNPRTTCTRTQSASPDPEIGSWPCPTCSSPETAVPRASLGARTGPGLRRSADRPALGAKRDWPAADSEVTGVLQGFLPIRSADSRLALPQGVTHQWWAHAGKPACAAAALPRGFRPLPASRGAAPGRWLDRRAPPRAGR
jgi:hypothetical protein